MPLRKEQFIISEKDYLQGEHSAEFKHEYIDGQVYAMVGASANHNHLAGNMFVEIKNHLKGSPCDVFISDFKVKSGTRFFYPDVIVRCDKDNNYYTEKPKMIVEVLSPTTDKYDRSFKLATYKMIPSLVEYIMIEQDKIFVEVYHRVNGIWGYVAYGRGDDVHLKSINLTLSMSSVYASVDNNERLPSPT